MKPKKKVRKSGFYWVKYLYQEEFKVAKYYEGAEWWNIIGYSGKYYDNTFSYISPTPITIPVTRSGHGKPKPRKK